MVPMHLKMGLGHVTHLPRSVGIEERRNKTLVDIEKLLEFWVQTDPIGGQTTAGEKDFTAWQAIAIADRVFDALAGWAIDHQVGLSLSKSDRELPEPMPPLEFAESCGIDPDDRYLEGRGRTDDHRFEIEGARLRSSEKFEHQPVVVRAMLIHVLRYIRRVLPQAAARELVEALRSLDHGEVLPLLKPAPAARKVNWRKSRLQLQALAFKEYRRAIGFSATKAAQDVADAFRIDKETLKLWARELPQKLGKLEVENVKVRARQHGRSVEQAQSVEHLRVGLMQGDDGVPSAYATSYLGKIELYQKDYNDDALRRAGADFRALMRKRRRSTRLEKPRVK